MTGHVLPLDLPALPGAACRGWPRPLWDYEIDTGQAETATARAARHDKAKAFCAGCPVKAACLDFGDREQLSGIYGGVLLRGKAVPAYDRAVARLTEQGRSARQIAAELSIDVRTVHRSRARELQRLVDAGVTPTTAAVLAAHHREAG